MIRNLKFKVAGMKLSKKKSSQGCTPSSSPVSPVRKTILLKKPTRDFDKLFQGDESPKKVDNEIFQRPVNIIKS